MSGINNVMVDIETTGTRPDRASIIQIAAVRFNLETLDVDTSSVFDRCLFELPHRAWESGTRQFWSRNAPVLRGIQSRMEDPKVVLQAFADWAGRDGAVMWAKPISFEQPFLESYFHDLNVLSPFHYRTNRDLRSYIQGLGVEEPKVAFTGDVHNALHDTIHQIEILFQAIKDARRG